MQMDGYVDIRTHLVKDTVDDEAGMAHRMRCLFLHLALLIYQNQIGGLDQAEMHSIRVYINRMSICADILKLGEGEYSLIQNSFGLTGSGVLFSNVSSDYLYIPYLEDSCARPHHR
jgi:hypothetical protein